MSTLISPVDIGGFPFNSNNGDRIYDASAWTGYFGRLVRTGVFPSPAGQFLVSHLSGMTLSTAAGALYVNGVSAALDTPQTVTLAYGDAALPRIDRVVARLDLSGRTVRLGVLQGIPAAAPAAPDLDRGSDAYDLCLCDVTVPAGAVALSESNLTDRRSDPAVCGWVSSVISDLPARVTRGLIYTAEENGGVGSAYTASVPGLSSPPDEGVHITVIPAADSAPGATLQLNGDAARPIYTSENSPVGAKGLTAGVPADLIYSGGKYFFKSAGGFSRYATGSLTPAKTFSVSDLSFRPKLVVLYGRYGYSSTQFCSYVCAGLFDAGGELLLWRPTYPQYVSAEVDPSLDEVSVTDSGFTVTFNQLKSANGKWPTASSGATVKYFCFA